MIVRVGNLRPISSWKARTGSLISAPQTADACWVSPDLHLESEILKLTSLQIKYNYPDQTAPEDLSDQDNQALHCQNKRALRALGRSPDK